MDYLYANWQRSPEGGWEPQLPDNHGFGLMAEPGRRAEWGLFRVSVADDADTGSIVRVGDQVCGLLRSGEAFPPAIALARNEVARQFDGQSVSRAEFEAYYGERLRHHLAGQDTSGYMLAKTVRDEIGYLTKGDYCWLVEYLPKSKQVKWVSGDYHIYRNDAADFDVPRYRLAPLSRWRVNERELAEMAEAVPPAKCAGAITVESLQRQIDDAANAAGVPFTIKLGRGSDDMDLTSNADVLAEWPGFQERTFSVLSQDWVARLFVGPSVDFVPPDIFAVGHPLIIVKQIDGSSIVRGVLRHLLLEDSRSI